MKYTLATLAALAGVVMAEPKFLNTEFDVVEGKPFTIKYSGCDSGCTIVLQNGESDDLKDYKTLTASAEGDSFTFTPSGLPSDTYNFKITDNSSGEENYSGQFPYQGDGVAPTSAAETSAAETTAAETKSDESTSAPATTEEATTLTSLTKSVHSTKAKTTELPTISTPAATKNATTPIPTSKRPTKTEGATSTEESASGTEPTATGEATTVPNSGAARMTSSLALIAGAVMAMVYLN